MVGQILSNGTRRSQQQRRPLQTIEAHTNKPASVPPTENTNIQSRQVCDKAQLSRMTEHAITQRHSLQAVTPENRLFGFHALIRGGR